LEGRQKTRPETLHRLAVGLGVAPDELFADPALLAHRLFDRRTNPLVETVIHQQPQLFAGWTERDFDELYSRFAAGGSLTEEGAVAAVEAMNHNREVHRRVALLLESGEAPLLSAMVEILYERIRVR
jgi:hypothetical protein